MLKKNRDVNELNILQTEKHTDRRRTQVIRSGYKCTKLDNEQITYYAFHFKELWQMILMIVASITTMMGYLVKVCIKKVVNSICLKI